MRYTVQQRVFIVSESLKNNQNFKLVKELFQREFGICAPKNESIKKMILKWQSHGTVCHFKGNSGRPKSIRTQTNTERVREVFEKNPRLSVRRASQLLDISKSSIHQILKDLGFHPYKTVKRHCIPTGKKEQRLIHSREIANMIRNNPALLPRLWFSDEANFQLTHSGNRQNDRNWCSEQPFEIFEKALHPEKTTAWCAISKEGS